MTNAVYTPFGDAMYTGDVEKLQTMIQKLLTQSVSYFDTLGENFYHGFMLGICALFCGPYVTSNRESGNGRYDIQLMPVDISFPGILIELKAAKYASEERLKNLAESALMQIVEKKYDTEMVGRGVKTILRYGVAFSGKNVEVVVG